MTIVESKDMHFGTMTVPTAVDSVMLTVLGAVSPVGVAVTLLAQTPTSHAAAYDVTGDPLATYEIILPDNVTVTVVSGSDHMHVVNFLSSKALNTSALDGSGDDNFTVGATLALINAQPAGTYTGTFNVSVAYN